MKPNRIRALGLAAAVALAAHANAAEPSIESITTPDTVDTRIGTLNFKDGIPSADTIDAVYDNLDLVYAMRAFTDTFQGVSVAAARQGFLDVGVKDNEFIIWSELMDAKSIFLTANADTVYFLGFVDLSNGPMVLETPPKALGTIDDAWFRWVTDFGAPGPDRGEGGRFLLVGPGYDGPLPEGGFYVSHSRTHRVLILGRSFLVDNDPKPAVETIKETMKLYPYEPGAVGTSIARFLEGGIELSRPADRKAAVFHEGTGLAINTVPPNDMSYYRLLDGLVQSEPATALDPELMGPIAAIGIRKGETFEPDERMTKILEDAVELANATSRTLGFAPRDPSWTYYQGSQWWNPLFAGGYQFETPPPEITPQGARPYPPTGYRQNSARTSFFYIATGITPAMVMRLTHVGSQYLLSAKDANGDYFDGAKTYKVTLPKGIPEANFWSFTVYDNQTRSMLATSQGYPRAGSQSFPSPAADPDSDGGYTIYFGPQQPEGVARGNYIETDPQKGWFTILRLYSPLEGFFDKSWQPSDIEVVAQ